MTSILAILTKAILQEKQLKFHVYQNWSIDSNVFQVHCKDSGGDVLLILPMYASRFYQ